MMCVGGGGVGDLPLLCRRKLTRERGGDSSERQERARKKAIVACGEEDEERWRESAASLDLWGQLGTLLQGTNCFYLFLNILFFKTFKNIYFQIYTFFFVTLDMIKQDYYITLTDMITLFCYATLDDVTVLFY